jgi:hypothetical protein
MSTDGGFIMVVLKSLTCALIKQKQYLCPSSSSSSSSLFKD